MVGQAQPLQFTKTGDGLVLDSDPGTLGNQPYIDVPFRNSDLPPGHPNYNTVSIAEIGLQATMATDVVGNPFAPLNNVFIDDFFVTRSGTSLPPPVPEPGFLLAAASLARLELRVMFEELLTRMPELSLAVPAEKLEYRPSNFIVGLEEMPVEFAARS